MKNKRPVSSWFAAPPFGPVPIGVFLNPSWWEDSQCWVPWPYWEPLQEFFTYPPYRWRGELLSAMDPVVWKSSNPVNPYLSTSLAVMPDNR